MHQQEAAKAAFESLSLTIPGINFTDHTATALVVVDVQYSDAAPDRGWVKACEAIEPGSMRSAAREGRSFTWQLARPTGICGIARSGFANGRACWKGQAASRTCGGQEIQTTRSVRRSLLRMEKP